jgi:hypothetical protein
MQTNKFLSLVRQLIGKDLVTEVDSPSDFSMGTSTGTTDIGTTGASDTSTSTVSSTSSNSSETSTSDDSTVDLGFDTSSAGGAGLTPTYNIDVDTDDEGNPINQQNVNPMAPKYRILDVIFDDDDDLNTKVKIQNVDTGETEIKNLDEIII